MTHYNVIVIGSGGGAKIARPAAELGHKVAMIEKGPLGGTCLNRGCIPSKMLIHAADVATQIKEAHRYEVDATISNVRFQELIQRVAQTIDADSASIGPVYDKHPNIDLYTGHARFIDNKTIEINNDQITADKIVITVGARPYIPTIPGLKDTPYWDSTTALRAPFQPKKLIVIGGGYIAVELGYFFAALGTDTTFIVRNQMLSAEDEEVITEFEAAFSSRYDVRLKTTTESVFYANNQFQVTIKTESGETQILQSDALLVATGVIPNTDDLGLNNTTIKLNNKGYIEVDEYLETSVDGVYAFGDVIGRYLFRHSANYEGDYLMKNIFEYIPMPIHYPPMPHAVFSNPQIGGVGETEQELRAKGLQKNIDYVVGKNAYAKSAMGMALRSEYGFAKMLVDIKSRQLLGAHIIGEESANMTHMAIAYMKQKATLDDILDTIFIHPAITEIFRNAARKAMAELETIK